MAMKKDKKLISPCSCGSRLLSIRYTEASRSFFNEDGGGREDGHDMEEAGLDLEHVWCRGCGNQRLLGDDDLDLIGEA